ncbi:MAG: DUF2182 domain-containing protein [Ferrovibrio sp.]|uniref:DUF2182 domain-containing protein n=1 Tax=Ferrovibrio sp. TaxID=1917215 RepID=UPI0026294D89|nr:DUF2182 domain-containing protein [Ferrovibrio sp.]MCW0233502.1 DUF2182 domain-containing protein [Ferrovibrio sp.]
MAARDSRYAAFFGIMALLFAGSATVTAMWCLSMATMGEIPMAGGWTMSMAWMPMCGQSWAGAAASFLGMWVVMMAAMMLPSLAPTLWRCYRAGGGARPTALAGAGYFFVWAMAGLAIFLLGAALAESATQWPALARAVPVAAGMVVLIAGAVQCTAWKARHLACCRQAPAGIGTAWHQGLHLGLRLGLHCLRSCAGLTAILLVIGVMDLRAMAIVTAAITLERLAPAGPRIARATGGAAIAAGLGLIVLRIGPGGL